MKRIDRVFCFFVLVFSASIAVPAQSGGTFTITQSVIASGGGASIGGAFRVTGTSGQHAAGTTASGAPFSVRGGFWQPGITPTAANVSVSGRVSISGGQGLRNAIVTLTDGQGVSLRAITSSFGYYRFDDVRSGETYIVAVASKRFQFEPRIITVADDLTDVDFVSSP